MSVLDVAGYFGESRSQSARSAPLFRDGAVGMYNAMRRDSAQSYRPAVTPLIAEPAVPKMRSDGSASILVDASPEQVYAIVSDITRTGEWSDECYRVVWTTSQRGVGARWKGWSRVGRIRWTRRGEIVEATPGRAFAYRTIPTLLKHDSTVWRFAIEHDGVACKLTHSYELTVLPYRLTAWLIARSLAEGTR